MVSSRVLLSMAKIEPKLNSEELCNEKIRDDNFFLFCGLNGEKVVECKANVSDSLAVITGFLVAFCISNLLSSSPSDFNKEEIFDYYLLSTAVATGCGFFSLFTFAFLSSKIRRLTGKPMYMFGDSTDDIEFVKKLHPDEWEKYKESFYCSSTKEIQFPARKWYYTNFAPISPNASMFEHFTGPVAAFQMALNGFYAMCIAFACSMCCKIYDSILINSAKHSTRQQVIGWLSMVILFIGIMLPLLLAHYNKSMYDLS